MPPLKFQSPEGKIITVDSPDGSMPSEQELDQLFVMAGNNQTIEQPKLGLPNAKKVATLIAQRENPVQALKEELQYYPNPLQHPIDFLMKKPVTLMKLANIPFSGIEAALANKGLAMQSGVQPSLLEKLAGPIASKEVWQGLTGKSQAQLGDIVRTTGFGGKLKLNELLSSLTGLLGMAGVTELASGRIPKPFEHPITSIKQAGGEIKQGINNIDKVFKIIAKKIEISSGLPKEEIVRLNTEYGGSNAGLVDTIKSKLKEKIIVADKAYQTALNSAPEGKQINIRPAIEQAGIRLKKLGLITDAGNLTELGQSEIARDSVYGKLLDFYKSADSISGVEKLQGKALTQTQMIKATKAMRETLVNKDQYTFFRDKLNALYKNKPSDIDVSKVVNQFYQDGENSGIKGLQQARSLTREAFQNEEKFLNKTTGDLRITEAKLVKIGNSKTPLSKQELDHIRELQKYIGHPIISDATKINKVNKVLMRIKDIKKFALIAGSGYAGGKLAEKGIRGFYHNP